MRPVVLPNWSVCRLPIVPSGQRIDVFPKLSVKLLQAKAELKEAAATRAPRKNRKVFITSPVVFYGIDGLFLSIFCNPVILASDWRYRFSGLNRRLGAGAKGAVAIERCGTAGDYHLGFAGTQARRACAVLRRPSSRPATGQRRRSTWRWNGSSQSEA